MEWISFKTFAESMKERTNCETLLYSWSHCGVALFLTTKPMAQGTAMSSAALKSMTQLCDYVYVGSFRNSARDYFVLL